MREYKIFILLFLFAGTLIMFFSCSKEETLTMDAVVVSNLYGVWKLEGYRRTDDVNYKETVFSNNPNAYFLTLNKDSTFICTTSVNNITGKFTIKPSRGNLSFTTNFDPYEVNESRDGVKYLNSLGKVWKFMVKVHPSPMELHLYYSNTEYLIYLPISMELYKNR